MKFNACLRDMNWSVPGNDERRIEVLAQDLLASTGPGQSTLPCRVLSALLGGGRGSVCPGSPREGGHIPGAADFEAMPTGRGRN